MSNKTDNKLKILYAAKVTIAYLLIAIVAGHVTSNFQIAAGILFAFGFWNMLWIRILLQSKNIYSVKILTEVLPDWIPVSLPAEKETIKIRKDRVVTSISELSGIRGGMMMVALRVMSSVTAVLTFMAIQNDLHHRKSTFLSFSSREDMVPIFLYLAAMGKFMTGHFELNLMDGVHTIGHYIGVMGISIGTLSIGFCLNWNGLSIFLLSLYFGLALIWTSYCAKCPKKSDSIQVVTRTSKICIAIELAMFNVYAIILALTCYGSGANEGNVFASPFLHDNSDGGEELLSEASAATSLLEKIMKKLN